MFKSNLKSRAISCRQGSPTTVPYIACMFSSVQVSTGRMLKGSTGTRLMGSAEILFSRFKKLPPDKGLEPLTSGLKVPRSTDWANRAIFHWTLPGAYIPHAILNCIPYFTINKKTKSYAPYRTTAYRHSTRPVPSSIHPHPLLHPLPLQRKTTGNTRIACNMATIAPTQSPPWTQSAETRLNEL